jgi:hypothetical protein
VGSNHFSHSIFDAEPAETRALLVAWMRAKGMALQDGGPKTPLDPQHERGLRIAWRDGVVVVLGDTLMELARQAFELRKLGRPLLSLWMHDSDIWGYELWSEGAVVSAFHSDPTYFGAQEPEQGPNDVERLCTLTGRGSPAEIRAIQKKTRLFAEGCSQALADALGAGAAATNYGYVGPMDPWPPEGWQTEHLWFREHGWDPMAGFDVSTLRFDAPEHPDPFAGLDPAARAEQEAAAAAAMKQAHRIGCAMQALMWPIQIPMRMWLWWRTRQLTQQVEGRAQQAASEARSVDWEALSTVELVDGRLRSPAHEVSVPVPAGADIGPQDRVTFGPGQVLGFTVCETPLRLAAHLPAAVGGLTRGMAHTGAVDVTTRELGPHIVRWARAPVTPFPGAPDAPPRERLMALLAGPQAVYAIDAMPIAEHADAVAAAIEEAIAGLRFEGGDAQP